MRRDANGRKRSAWDDAWDRPPYLAVWISLGLTVARLVVGAFATNGALHGRMGF